MIHKRHKQRNAALWYTLCESGVPSESTARQPLVYSSCGHASSRAASRVKALERRLQTGLTGKLAFQSLESRQKWTQVNTQVNVQSPATFGRFKMFLTWNAFLVRCAQPNPIPRRSHRARCRSGEICLSWIITILEPSQLVYLYSRSSWRLQATAFFFGV